MHLCVPCNTASSGYLGQVLITNGKILNNFTSRNCVSGALQVFSCLNSSVHHTISSNAEVFSLWFQVFCATCCSLKCKLLYMDRKEARVCVICHSVLMNGEWRENLRRSTSLALC